MNSFGKLLSFCLDLFGKLLHFCLDLWVAGDPQLFSNSAVRLQCLLLCCEFLSHLGHCLLGRRIVHLRPRDGHLSLRY